MSSKANAKRAVGHHGVAATFRLVPNTGNRISIPSAPSLVKVIQSLDQLGGYK